MDIQNELLKRVLSKPFGWNLATRNLLESSSAEEDPDEGGNKELSLIDEALSQRAGRRLVAEEINKQKNMEDVVQRADEILQAEPAPTADGEESDQGWIEECLDGAGKAYHENLKNYWARLLAGEIKHPGFYSLRAIDFMKKLSKKDAERIRRICQYVMYDNKGDAVIFKYDAEEISYGDLSFLMELRLLDSSSFVVKQYKFETGEGHAFLFKNNVGFLIKVKKREYDLPIYSFTELGKEILTIIDDTGVNLDYLKNFATEITKMKEIEVVVGEFIRNGTSVSFLRNDKYFEIPIKLNAEESAQEGSK